MTGLKMPEKTAVQNENPEADQPVGGERKRSLLIGVITSLSTALVLGGIFCGVIFYLQNKHIAENEEWISWTRRAGKVDLHESVLINEDEQTILMVSAEAYRNNEQNSMALHDFKLGYVALRDFQNSLCLVTNVKNPDFNAVKTMLEARQGKQLDLQPLQHATVQARNMTSSELGTKLSKFCDGATAHWMEIKPETGVVKRKASPTVVVITEVEKEVTIIHTLSCIIQRITYTITQTVIVIRKKK